MPNNQSTSIAKRLCLQGFQLFPQMKGDVRKSYIKGYYDGAASGDPDQIDTWAREFPKANFAVICGEASGIFVIDIDVHDGAPDGRESWQTLLNKNGNKLPDTMAVATPSGGRHYFFLWDKRLDEMKAKFHIVDSVEFCGNRSCVTAVGSFMDSGATYRWRV